ncbi:MAG: putative nucleotidyltransferase with HDIG domain [Candidatus Pelagisphaera sp.]|jgi:putative nucleotidyltransferase with HDIG domain
MISHPINLEDIQPELDGIAVSPQILPKLQELISDCNTNPDEIRDMIRLDPALSAMILKTANSAYFNPGYHIDSIDDGIMHLGFSDVYQIVTMLTFSELFAEPLKTYGISAGDFWSRSVACAFAMERLARKYSEDPGVAYTVGLLHGIGMVFLEREIKDASNITFNASLPEDVALAKEELEIFGINHAKVGAAMMREWGFSDEVVIPVLNQFEPAQAGKHERMACLVSFAKRMISTIINDPTSSATIPGPDPLLIALLHLSKEEYLKVVDQLRANFEKAESLVTGKTVHRPMEGARTGAVKDKLKKAIASNLGYGQSAIRS